MMLFVSALYSAAVCSVTLEDNFGKSTVIFLFTDSHLITKFQVTKFIMLHDF